MVLISASAKRELKKMGCGVHGPNFLRVSRAHNRKIKCGFFIDSTLAPADKVIHDGDIKVVTDLNSTPFMHNLSIDFDSSGITIS